MEIRKHIQYKDLVFHLLGWFTILGSPFILLERGKVVDWSNMPNRLEMPLFMLLVFYVNYLWRHANSKHNYLTLVNILLIGGICLFLSLRKYLFFHEIASLQPPTEFVQEHQMPPPHLPLPGSDEQHPPIHSRGLPLHAGQKSSIDLVIPIFFTLRDLAILLMSAVGGILIRRSKELSMEQAARKEAELGRAEAELKNLRNQINPHFLLNTLNNIYALIQFNTDKAQEAVQDLSKLLRHALYDNQQDFIPLSSEVDFENKYINLMRMRLPRQVQVEFTTQLPESSNHLQIAPLLLISLVENAFKHGIGTGTDGSFIRINLEVKNDTRIIFRAENSNHPKNETDRSGSGIGMEQVQKRLALIYPNRYSWERGISVDGLTYSSVIEIETNPEKTLNK